MKTLAELTGADIAASTDRTGHVSEYANWDLEVSVGFIETSIVIGEATQEAWEGVWPPIPSRRRQMEAQGRFARPFSMPMRIQAPIRLPLWETGPISLTIGGTGEDSAVTGDLDITDERGHHRQR